MSRDKFITAEIVADSVNTFGDRLTTFVVTLPRIVLAEFNTHRMFSRNSASSRAIPFKTMVDKVKTEPFIPIKWQKDHKGMQGTEYITKPKDIEFMDSLWLRGRDRALTSAIVLNQEGVTKQLCNRMLEPYLYHTIIVTSSEWENFFALRAHEAAEIHIQNLAYKMLEKYNESKPKELQPKQWHIPFGDKMDKDRLVDLMYKLNNDNYLIKTEVLEQARVEIAVARCARVSYLNYEGTDDYQKDLKLTDRLAKMGHWSPFEHCASAMTEIEHNTYGRNYPVFDNNKEPVAGMGRTDFGWLGNFRGFVQYRKTFEDENKTDKRIK